MSVERHARFQPQRVTRGQTCRKNTFIGAVIAGVQELVPELTCIRRISIDLESVFAGVASAGNYRVNSIDHSDGEMVILDLVKIGGRQFFEDELRQRSLNGDLAIIRTRV